MTYPQPSSSSSVPAPLQDDTQEPDELTRFRNDWRQAVALHNRAEATNSSSASKDGTPAGEHYTAEELPKAQDSFVSLAEQT
jgi:hypothetical protein